MDPLFLVMLALLALMVFFMFRNGRKRKQAMEELRQNLNPGVEVMLGAGIYGHIVSVDETAQRAVINSAGSTIEVHIGAIAQLVPVVEPEVAADAAVAADPLAEPVAPEQRSVNSADNNIQR